VANDLAGTQQSIRDALDAMFTDKGNWNNENELRMWRLFRDLLHAKALANGVSIL